MAFKLVSATQLGLAVVRVTFNNPPKRLDPTGANDALNIANYAFTGPAVNAVSSVVEVVTDLNSVDVYLVAPLVSGVWTVSVANIRQTDNTTLTSPTTAQFVVAVQNAQEALAQGAANPAAYNVLRRLFNPALKGPNWDALLSALATGDNYNWDTARLAFDQLTVATATGTYLKKQAGNYGIQHFPGVGLSDDLFRQLTIALTTNTQTQLAVTQVLEIFYGREATGAFALSDVVEPYQLQDQDQLVLQLDEGLPFVITFQRPDFARIGEALALEVAASITRTCLAAQIQAFAVASPDPSTGRDKVKIFSGRLGLSGSVRVVGGRAQTQLQFPQGLYITSGSSPFASWTITLSPDTTGNVRFTETAGIYDLNALQTGDLVYIYGPEFAGSTNVGTFEVQNVSVSYTPSLVQWFEITNPVGTGATVSQTQFDDLVFFRPFRNTIYDHLQKAFCAQADGGLFVTMSAVTHAVNREVGTAAYLNDQPPLTGIQSITRTGDTVTVSLTDPMALLAGNQIEVSGCGVDVELNAGVWAIPNPTKTAGTPSPDFAAFTAVGVTDASLVTTASLAHTYQGIYHKAVSLPTGELFIVGGETQAAGVSTTISNPVVLDIETTTELPTGRQEEYRWKQLASHASTTGRRDFGLSRLKDGRVVATGGHNSTNSLVVAASNAWDMFFYDTVPGDSNQTSGIIPTSLAAHGQCIDATTIETVIVSGGWAAAWTDRLTAAYQFNPQNSSWVALASMKVARAQHELVWLGNFKIMAIGGRQSLTNPLTYNNTILNTCEIYNGTGNVWNMAARMTYARFAFGVVTLPDKRVMVIGGIGYDPSLGTAAATLKTTEIYDPTTGFWTMGPTMAVARDFPVVAYIATTNTLMVAGGTGVTSIEILNLATMTWRPSIAATTIGHLRAVGGVLGTDTFAIVGGSLNASPDSTEKVNFMVVPGDETLHQGGVNGFFEVDAILSATALTYLTPDHPGYSSPLPGTQTAPTQGVPGSFIFDPTAGSSITATRSELVSIIQQGQHYTAITVADTEFFPPEGGFLVFNWGYENQVGPVKYLGILSSTLLELDAGFKFPLDIAPGANVVLLQSRSPAQIAVNKVPNPFYLTDSAAGRVAAESVVEDIVAAGIDLDVTIVYPGDAGVGAAGFPDKGNYKLSDIVSAFAGNDVDQELAADRVQS